MNADTDTISCESCGAHLYFSAPASWSKQQGTVWAFSFVCVYTVNKLDIVSVGFLQWRKQPLSSA